MNFMRKKNQTAFTLIELLIVIVIISAIMAYAIPSYRDYVLRANRTEAKNALNAMAGIQERFYANNNKYGTAAEVNLSSLYPAPTAANGLKYSISMVSTDTSYTITADASGTQQKDTSCPKFTVDNLGQRTPASDCWR